MNMYQAAAELVMSVHHESDLQCRVYGQCVQTS